MSIGFSITATPSVRSYSTPRKPIYSNALVMTAFAPGIAMGNTSGNMRSRSPETEKNGDTDVRIFYAFLKRTACIKDVKSSQTRL